jgi:hypothetical protein
MESKKFASKVSDLVGTYQKSGSKITRQDLEGHLLLSVRKTATPTKSPLFLLYKTPQKDYYVSSMYPVKDHPDSYKIEWKGQIAFVTLGHQSVTITPMVGQTALYINSSLVTESVTKDIEGNGNRS